MKVYGTAETPVDVMLATMEVTLISSASDATTLDQVSDVGIPVHLEREGHFYLALGMKVKKL